MIKTIVNKKFNYLSDTDKEMIIDLAENYFLKEKIHNINIAKECVEDAAMYLEYYIFFK